MDQGISAYLGVYLDELEEQLQILDEECLRLEREGANAETIQRIFRAAHTLKGSSAAMGFEAIKELTHRVENVFDGIRSGRLGVSVALINVLFAALDVLRGGKTALLAGRPGDIEVGGLLERLELICTPGELEASASQADGAADDDGLGDATQLRRQVEAAWRYLDETQRSVVAEGCESGYRVYAVYARTHPQALMKQVRALLVCSHLQELGELVASYPAAAAMDSEEFNGEMVYVLATLADETAILQLLEQIADIAEIVVREVLPQAETPPGSAIASRTDAATPGAEQALASVAAEPPAGLQAEPEEAAGRECDAGTAAQPVMAPVVPAGAAGTTPRSAEPAAGAQSAASPAAAAGDPESKVKVNPTVRVDVERLERLLNFVGELIINNTRLHEVKHRLNGQFRENGDVQLLNDIAAHFGRVIGELQDGMMKTRMLPIEQLFNRFPRTVRDIAIKSGKDIDFVIEGRETELDRTLIEELGDPILHILRNAADHGLESPEERQQAGKPAKGRLVLKAAHQENQIVITISDDGRGIDPERIKQSAIRKGFVTAEAAERMTREEQIFLIFHSGVSTAAAVTDLSGRGVGMDIVRAHIEKLNGIIHIDTEVGQGTVFTIKLPLTLAIIRSLLIKLGRQTFAVPLVNVIEIVRLSAGDIRTVQGQEVCLIRGAVFPLVRMHSRLQIQGESATGKQYVVILGHADKRVCLAVDGLVGNQEIVIKSLGDYVGNVPYIAGSTILGDGSVALILDVGTIAREEGSMLADVRAELYAAERVEKDELQLVTFRLADGQYALDIERMKEIITVPPVTRVVSAPGELLGMINLRGSMLPVWDLRACLGLPPTDVSPKTRIIVVELGGKDVGIRVDQVTEVLKILRSELQAVPKELLDSRPGAMEQACRHEGGFVLLLQLERILPREAASFGPI